MKKQDNPKRTEKVRSKEGGPLGEYFSLALQACATNKVTTVCFLGQLLKYGKFLGSRSFTKARPGLVQLQQGSPGQNIVPEER